RPARIRCACRIDGRKKIRRGEGASLPCAETGRRSGGDTGPPARSRAGGGKGAARGASRCGARGVGARESQRARRGGGEAEGGDRGPLRRSERRRAPGLERGKEDRASGRRRRTVADESEGSNRNVSSLRRSLRRTEYFNDFLVPMTTT